MLKKIMMTVALITFIGTSFVNAKMDPQSKIKTELTSATFQDDIQEFNIATTQQQQEQSVEKILNSMRRGIEFSKANIAKAKSSGDAKEQEKALKIHQSRSAIYNEVIILMRNDSRTKEETMSIFKQYAETL